MSLWTSKLHITSSLEATKMGSHELYQSWESCWVVVLLRKTLPQPSPNSIQSPRGPNTFQKWGGLVLRHGRYFFKLQKTFEGWSGKGKAGISLCLEMSSTGGSSPHLWKHNRSHTNTWGLNSECVWTQKYTVLKRYPIGQQDPAKECSHLLSCLSVR